MSSLGKFSINNEKPPHTRGNFEKLNTVTKAKCCEDTEKLECSHTTGGSMKWHPFLERSGDTIPFKANFTRWRSLHFVDYIITSVSEMTTFLIEEMKTLLLSMSKQHKKKSYFGKTVSYLFLKNFRMKTRFRPSPLFPNLHSAWNTRQPTADWLRLTQTISQTPSSSGN